MTVQLNELFEFELPVSITIKTGKAMKLSKEEYKDLISALVDAMNSFRSAHEQEKKNEAARVQRWIDELEPAEMKRRDSDLIELAARKIREAELLISSN